MGNIEPSLRSRWHSSEQRDLEAGGGERRAARGRSSTCTNLQPLLLYSGGRRALPCRSISHICKSEISISPPSLSLCLSRDHLSPPIRGGLSTNTMRHQWDSSDLQTYALSTSHRQDTKYLITNDSCKGVFPIYLPFETSDTRPAHLSLIRPTGHFEGSKTTVNSTLLK